jgi:glycosyltransferase involved in cell wall biosynthesis
MLIANSRYTTARFTQGYRPDKVDIVHNPVDLTRFSPDRISRAEGRVRLGLEADGPVLGVIGQLTPWKGQDDAMRCLTLLRPRWPTARLLVVGSAVFTSKATRYDNLRYVRALNSLAVDLGLNGSLRFLGEREDVPAILRAVDILLVPSWEEPFGRSVIEAMAMAVPVVATDVGGPAEIITHGVDGMLLPPRQPARWARTIDELLSQPRRLAEMGCASRRTAVERFTVGAHVARVLSVYRRVLGSQPN